MTKYAAIEAAARERIASAIAVEQRARVANFTEAGVPTLAEPDQQRVAKRLEAQPEMLARAVRSITLNPKAAPAATRAIFKSVVSDAESSEAEVASAEAARPEAIQGRTTDFVSVAFLDLARAAARTVARIIFRDGRPYGTGFMISDRLLITNNHVISSAEEAQQFLAEFDYELDVFGRARPVTRFKLDPETFFFTSPSSTLDFTVIAIGSRELGGAELGSFGYLPLLDTDDKHGLGDFVNIAEHPNGDYKQVVVRENQIVTRLETVLHYKADTLGGSSGSLVANDRWEAVALHHYAGPFLQTVDANGKPVEATVNEGIRISRIVGTLSTALAGLSQQKRDYLKTVLNPKSRFPSTLGDSVPLVLPVKPEAGTAPAAAQYGFRCSPDGTATWTLPLELSVRLPGMAQAQPQAAADSQETRKDDSGELGSALGGLSGAEKVVIDKHYDQREGYDPDFLPGKSVPLPKLSDKLLERVARLTDDPEQYELKYEHFSVVVNGARRLPQFTAVNIDGANLVKVDRDTGEPVAESFESAEKWYIDPRIAAEEQSEQKIYDRAHGFDRGHLVRREDPNWGTDAVAKRANADTFHFSNCTPQAGKAFNRKLWLGLENYILLNAGAERSKVTVFTGPVLRADDPELFDTGIKLPLRFWKVFVRVKKGKLLATALLADQSDYAQELLAAGAEAFEDPKQLKKIKQYQSTVRQVEKLSGLSFGSLKDHDTSKLAAKPEAIGGAEALGGAEEVEVKDFGDLEMG